MQPEYRFNAFGRLLAVVRSNDSWTVFDVGTERKRRPAGPHIPSALAAHELAQYLGDLLYENASPKYNDVVPVPLPRRA
ncbi:DUF7661 family protein [Burkholderia latens]|uniref:DUF7661 domain-containing protein n=1 Tax=Burkholderia latens TaxID=488446 RepID=A0A6H9SK83_9BURK|nr:hypothetical protein [Burkholderia latens]KAB0638581.1 hypothetical protein F7R21_19735 [Burkholderia latens]VWB10828.1 hypothetical protein BLA24064_00326 [Burkholderia latens]